MAWSSELPILISIFYEILTHIGHSEKVLVMRVFIAVLVLIFGLQSWTKADDISDFEIEGMSIGDSLLDYFDKSYIDKKGKHLYPNKDFKGSKFTSNKFNGKSTKNLNLNRTQ